MSKTKVTILGDGGWGTALAMLLCGKGSSVSLWGAFPDYIEVLKKSRENTKFLPGFTIPDKVLITSDIKEALEDSEAIIIAIPSKFLRSTLRGLRGAGFTGKTIISAVKGIEPGTFKPASDIIEEVLGLKENVVLSGPTIAREVAEGLPTSAVVGSTDEAKAIKAQEILHTERFRVYTCADAIGVELGGALKNIIAIAAGACDGLGFGTNAKSALFTRGLVEMKRIGVALGAKEETFNGLSGIGDLMTTCTSPYSRNRCIGEEIAKGKSLKDILKNMEMVAEGIETSRSIYEESRKMSLTAPIAEEVYRVLFEGKDPLLAVASLMTRTKKAE
ncbi:MAG: NAD(P)-dependent glycerol-3-phosphate dehydrogenase [Candidatus Omnitrophica bacterium]|nr:NAD(P)-dependent glycerol-3-phosphate dehydrogenase [Candidatus Omnitrophota bacterium]